MSIKIYDVNYVYSTFTIRRLTHTVYGGKSISPEGDSTVLEQCIKYKSCAPGTEAGKIYLPREVFSSWLHAWE